MRPSHTALLPEQDADGASGQGGRRPPVPTRPRRGPRPEQAQAAAEFEVSVEVRLDLTPPVVTVAGVLGASGAGLLTAVLEYVAHQHGRLPVVDLREVSDADRSGVAPVVELDVELCASSPAVDRMLHEKTGLHSPGRAIPARARPGLLLPSGQPEP